MLTSTNQHGVHSPFMYDYITKCLYIKSKHKASKVDNVVLKSISYFKMKSIKFLKSDAPINNRIQKVLGLNATNTLPFDFIYSEKPSLDLLSIFKEQIHNDSMLLINNIHSTKSNANTWDALKQNEAATVSVDMFYCGAIFFRKEQVKEHFKIRI